MDAFAEWIVAGGWQLVVLVAAVLLTVAVTVPLTVRFCDNRQPVHPAVTFDPAYVKQLNAARAEADEAILSLVNRQAGWQRERDRLLFAIEAEREWSEKLRQRALRAARSNRLARIVIRELVGWDARQVRRWAREQGLV